jgi:hypothetical protein
VLEDPDAIEIEPETARFGEKALRWLLERFLGEIEGSPSGSGRIAARGRLRRLGALPPAWCGSPA